MRIMRWLLPALVSLTLAIPLTEAASTTSIVGPADCSAVRAAGVGKTVCFDETDNRFYGWDGTGWTSEVARALRWVVVTDRRFGARADGVTDDRAAIQAAIDAGGVGSSILFTPGVYITRAPIRYRDQQTLFCLGKCTIRLAGAGSYVLDSITPALQLNRVWLIGLRLEVDDTVNKTAGGINVENVRAAYLQNVTAATISGAPSSSSGIGIRIVEDLPLSSLYGRLEFVTISGFATGLLLQDMNSVTGAHIRQTSGSVGVQLKRTVGGIAVQGNSLRDVAVESNSVAGVRLSGVVQNYVQIAYAENNTGASDLLLEDSGGYTCKHNVIGFEGKAGSATSVRDNSSGVNQVISADDDTSRNRLEAVTIQPGSAAKQALILKQPPGGSTATTFLEFDSATGAEEFSISKNGQLRHVGGISATATFSTNLRGQSTFARAGTKSVSFGAAEPDNSYFIIATPNVNETIWVTNKLTTGFTLNSSNRASTAVVDWILVR